MVYLFHPALFDMNEYLLVLFGMFCSVRFRLEDMVLTDTEALAARRDLADRLKQREYQMAVDADMEVGFDQVKTHKFPGVSIASYWSTINTKWSNIGFASPIFV